MKTIQDACIDFIRRISKTHAAKCDRTDNVNIAEQSSKKLSELTGEIKINLKNVDEVFLERIKEE